MKFTCNRQILSEAVTNASRAVFSKSSVAALEGILINGMSDNSITLTGYDLEMGIITDIEAAVSVKGEIVVNAKLFGEIVRKIDSETIELESEENFLVKIKGGKSEFSLMGLDAAEYPEIPNITSDTDVIIDSELIKSMIDQTIYAVSTSDQKPIHTGSLFEINDGIMTLISVDGYRLAMRNEEVEYKGEESFVVPGKTLTDLSKMITPDDDKTTISVGKKHIIFKFGGYQIISRLLEGTFLDYKATIPENKSTSAVIDVKNFIDSIERTALLITDRLRSPLKVVFESNTIKLSCTTSIGKASDEMYAEIDGNMVKMGFNNKYLLDALRATNSDEVLIEIGGALSPMKILPKEGNKFLFLVLPVRLKSE